MGIVDSEMGIVEVFIGTSQSKITDCCFFLVVRWKEDKQTIKRKKRTRKESHAKPDFHHIKLVHLWILDDQNNQKKKKIIFTKMFLAARSLWTIFLSDK